MASTHSVKGSDVKYRESDKAYSFHTWASRDCEDARREWLRTKNPAQAKG